MDWVGLANFVKILKDPAALRAVTNTLLFSGITVPLAVRLGLVLALLINGRTKVDAFTRAAVPSNHCTMTVMSLVWSFILHERIGPVKALLDDFGLPSVSFFSDPYIVLVTLAFIAVWQHACFCFILFLSGLTTIPGELYDAAALDGTDRGWEKFRRILATCCTRPSMRPMTAPLSLRCKGCSRRSAPIRQPSRPL